MTNAEIILHEGIRLMKEGVIKGSGIFAEDGTELPERLNTYATWKSLGFQVRKGEKAKAQFSIWKHRGYEKDNTEISDDDMEKLAEKTKHHDKMIMVLTSFFTIDQVEKIVKEG